MIARLFHAAECARRYLSALADEWNRGRHDYDVPVDGADQLAEREAAEEVAEPYGPTVYCAVATESGLLCTRPRGHDGEHGPSSLFGSLTDAEREQLADETLADRYPRCPECDGLAYRPKLYLHRLNCPDAQPFMTSPAASDGGDPEAGPVAAGGTSRAGEAQPPGGRPGAGHLTVDALMGRVENLERRVAALGQRIDDRK